MSETTLTIDIGNSTASWAIWCGSAVVGAGSLRHPEIDAALPVSWEQAGRVGVATVHSEVADRLLARLSPSDRATRLLSSYRDVPIEVGTPHPEQVGVDRLLNALAWSRHHPGEAAVIIDFGTAITLDLVDAEGVFRGGLILPGAQLLARSLARETALLPEVNLTPDLAPFGTDTESSIVRGVSGLLIGGVERLAERARLGFAPAARVIATGGGAPVWAPNIPSVERVLPQLTLEGVRIALEEAD